MRNASAAMSRRDRNRPDQVGRGPSPVTERPEDETFHVFGSGNLGLVYVRGEKQRLTRAELDERYPGLVTGIARHPGVGFVAVMDDALGPVAVGGEGSVRLLDGHVEGVDPLVGFGPHAHEFVLRAASRPEAPDIYVNSLVEPGTEDVAAFEGLVGCHGGLGGWQDRAFVMVPNGVPFPTSTVVGADSMHVALAGILRHFGHRAQVPDEVAPAAMLGPTPGPTPGQAPGQAPGDPAGIDRSATAS